jgi:hypothetical protein
VNYSDENIRVFRNHDHELLSETFARLNWASQHATKLIDEIKSLPNMAEIVAINIPNSRKFIYQVKSTNTIPNNISLILGDALHNYRSALDHIVFKISEFHGLVTPENIRNFYFPVSLSKEKYHESYLRCMFEQHLPPGFITTLDECEPYKGGNCNLYELHELNIIDKHRKTVTLGFSGENILVHGTVISLNSGNEKLEVGQNLLTIDFSKVDEIRHPEISLHLCFSAGEHVGKPVQNLLNVIQSSVERIIQKFSEVVIENSSD